MVPRTDWLATSQPHTCRREHTLVFSIIWLKQEYGWIFRYFFSFGRLLTPSIIIFCLCRSLPETHFLYSCSNVLKSISFQWILHWSRPPSPPLPPPLWHMRVISGILAFMQSQSNFGKRRKKSHTEKETERKREREKERKMHWGKIGSQSVSQTAYKTRQFLHFGQRVVWEVARG